MYDTEIYTHDNGGTLTISYIHGRESDNEGGSKDVTVAVVSHQSADGLIFHNHIIDGPAFDGRLEVLINTYKGRGYKLPGSDTQEAPTINVEMYDSGKGHPYNDPNFQPGIVHEDVKPTCKEGYQQEDMDVKYPPEPYDEVSFPPDVDEQDPPVFDDDEEEKWRADEEHNRS